MLKSKSKSYLSLSNNFSREWKFRNSRESKLDYEGKLFRSFLSGSKLRSFLFSSPIVLFCNFNTEGLSLSNKSAVLSSVFLLLLLADLFAVKSWQKLQLQLAVKSETLICLFEETKGEVIVGFGSGTTSLLPQFRTLHLCQSKAHNHISKLFGACH